MRRSWRRRPRATAEGRRGAAPHARSSRYGRGRPIALSVSSSAVVQYGAPLLLDVAEPPDSERDDPRRDEQADDAEPEHAEVEPRDSLPDRPAERPLGLGDLQQLYGADDPRGGDGQSGDREVVVDLAHRLGEGPAVGEVHERSVDRVEQA